MVAYTDITGLGRELNPRIPSNRFAVIGAVGAFAVLLVVSWIRDEVSVPAAAFGAVSVFIGWAISRELDPDRPDAAALAMAVALAAAVVAAPSALASGVVLIALRLIAGTVGVALKPLDLVVLAGVAGVAGATPILWLAGAALGIWAWTAPESVANQWPTRIAFVAGALTGLAVAAWTTWFGDGYGAEITTEAYALAAAAGLAMLLSIRHLPIASRTDAGTHPIRPERVRLARLTAGAILMWAAVIGGVEGFWALGPAFSALVMAAVYRVFVHAA